MRGSRFMVAGALVLGMVGITQAQFGRGGGAGPSGLVVNKAVQEDLKIGEDDAKKLAEWSKEFQKTTAEIYKTEGVDLRGGFGKQPTPEEQEKRTAAAAKVSKEAYKQLGEVLKKEQIERLKQIERQNQGMRAFTNAEVVEALKLTDSQKTSVTGISGDFAKESREILGGAGGKVDFTKMAENQAKVAKLQKEYLGKVADLLEDSQKKAWKDLVGEPFDLTKLQPTFGKKDTKKD